MANVPMIARTALALTLSTALLAGCQPAGLPLAPGSQTPPVTTPGTNTPAQPGSPEPGAPAGPTAPLTALNAQVVIPAASVSKLRSSMRAQSVADETAQALGALQVHVNGQRLNADQFSFTDAGYDSMGRLTTTLKVTGFEMAPGAIITLSTVSGSFALKSVVSAGGSGVTVDVSSTAKALIVEQMQKAGKTVDPDTIPAASVELVAAKLTNLLTGSANVNVLTASNLVSAINQVANAVADGKGADQSTLNQINQNTGGGGTGGGGSSTATFTLAASEFVNGKMPVDSYNFTPANKGTGSNNGKTPALSWNYAPSGTKSFAVVMRDTMTPWIHWVMYDIPAGTTSLKKDLINSVDPQIEPDLPTGTKFGLADYDGAHTDTSQAAAKYVGPYPPSGSHTYETTIYALSLESAGNAGMTEQELMAAIAGKILGQTKVSGTATAYAGALAAKALGWNDDHSIPMIITAGADHQLTAAASKFEGNFNVRLWASPATAPTTLGTAVITADLGREAGKKADGTTPLNNLTGFTGFTSKLTTAVSYTPLDFEASADNPGHGDYKGYYKTNGDNTLEIETTFLLDSNDKLVGVSNFIGPMGTWWTVEPRLAAGTTPINALSGFTGFATATTRYYYKNNGAIVEFFFDSTGQLIGAIIPNFGKEINGFMVYERQPTQG